MSDAPINAANGVPPRSGYDRVGADGFADLIGRFYAKVRADDLIGPMYPPDDWENAEARLRGFLVQRFGGPTTYSQQRGHPRLRMRHAPFPINPAAAERWLALMNRSLHESIAAGAIDLDAASELWPYFVDTARHMVNRDEEPAPGY